MFYMISLSHTDVIHTVGPVARGHVGEIQKDLLRDCYVSSLNLLREHHLRSVAFPCISTGIYGFPNDPAAKIALTTVKSWLEKYSNEIPRSALQKQAPPADQSFCRADKPAEMEMTLFHCAIQVQV
ncbi:hypothetical protein GJAV_G00237850 [Gymnothorax javanicus]|nr:hypothetical protein GJAV_G00237850 [Gymnothorax javanicus]